MVLPVAEHDVLQIAARVRGSHEHEDARAAAANRAEERLDRVAPEPGVDGERVGTRRLAAEVRLGVGAGGRADVTALAVCDHEEPGTAGVGAHLVERGHARRPGGFEEGQLRLDGDRVRRDGVDDPAAEAGDVTAQLDREQVRIGIESDDELRPLARDLGGKTIGERQRRHGHGLER